MPWQGSDGTVVITLTDDSDGLEVFFPDGGSHVQLLMNRATLYVFDDTTTGTGNTWRHIDNTTPGSD